MLSLTDLKTATGMYIRDIIQAIIHEGFPTPIRESGRAVWHPSEIHEWMKCRSTKGLPKWAK
jgi:predicted DNA-binding transcriptional regulator AlpA